MNKESNGGAYFRKKEIDQDEERVWCLESLVSVWFVA